MRRNVFLLLNGLVAFLGGVELSANPDVSTNLQLRMERTVDGLEMSVTGPAGYGSLFLYTASDLQTLVAAPLVIQQTNTSLGATVRLLLPSGRASTGQTFYTAIHWPGFNPGTNMVYIPAGGFTMGSPSTELGRYVTEGPETQVTIRRGFWMGRYEVTQAEYLELMGQNPSHFTGDSNRPVEQVEWFEAAAYCDALTARQKNQGGLPAGYAYRLPTEAEWEYACRAGTTTTFNPGNEMRSGTANFHGQYEYPPCDGVPDYCLNLDGVFLEGTVPVGRFAPNAWGLHDMHGNVYEWCADWWSETLPGGTVIDPTGPADGAPRVIRGGGWLSYAVDCRSASRLDSNPIHGNYDVGFRVVLAPIK